MVSNLLTTFAAASCKTEFLGLKPWNYYLDMTDPAHGCELQNFTFLGGHSSLLLIILVIVDDLFRLAGILAVVFIIYAGFKYITSQGEPAETQKALGSALNALIGLGIALVAIAFVSFLGNQAGSSVAGGNQSSLDVSSLPNIFRVDSSAPVQTALSISFGILGAVAFMVIVIAGLKYTLSQGDAQATAKAKNTIIYALVGLVLAIVAQSLVSLSIRGAP